jgi:hypothetical protein
LNHIPGSNQISDVHHQRMSVSVVACPGFEPTRGFEQAAASGKAIKILPGELGCPPITKRGSRHSGFRDVANLRHPTKHSRHHTKDKQRFVVSVVAYDSLPGHQHVHRYSARSGLDHGCYATNRGITLSTNRKNRVLRAPATTDSCDTGDRAVCVSSPIPQESGVAESGVAPPGSGLAQ